MNGNLFRTEALQGQTDRLYGDVVIVPSVKSSMIAVALILWTSALVLWLINGEYTQNETVRGWLESDKPVLHVLAESANGKIKQILTNEGDYVEKGQPLIVINGDRILQDGSNLEEQLLLEYQNQKDILSQQLEQNSKIFSHRIQAIHHRISTSDQKIRQLNDQLVVLKQRHQLAQQTVNESRAKFAQGGLSASELDSVVALELLLRIELAGLKRGLIKQESDRQDLHSDLKIFPEEQQNIAAGLRRQLSEIAQHIAQLHGKRAHIIKATQSGYVSNIQAHLGQQIKEHLPLLTIVPADSVIQARILVPVRAAGFLKSGQKLKMRIDAFPYQKFALNEGIISKISKTTILPYDANKMAMTVDEPVLIVWANLERNWVKAFGEQLSLKPGMTLSADVQVAQKSMLEWLLPPILNLDEAL